MGLTDGTVLGATKLVHHGSDQKRWTLVLVAEGYQATEMAKFQTDAQSFVTKLFATPPFDTFQAAINVYRLDVASTDSGADDPVACSGTGAAPATFFDASFCSSGDIPTPVRRLLRVNEANVLATVRDHVPHWDMIMVVVNSTVYGGFGGDIAVFSTAAHAMDIGIHEMGHTAFGLADEYPYWAGCGVDVDHDHHPATEPSAPNVTLD